MSNLPIGAEFDLRNPDRMTPEPDEVLKDVDPTITLSSSTMIRVSEYADTSDEFLAAFHDQFPSVIEMLMELKERYEADIVRLEQKKPNGWQLRVRSLQKRIIYINSFHNEEVEL